VQWDAQLLSAAALLMAQVGRSWETHWPPRGAFALMAAAQLNTAGAAARGVG
jgi:hypothetical protein